MVAEVEIAVNWVCFGLLPVMVVATAGAQPEKGKELNERGLAAEARGDSAAARSDLSEALRIWQSLGSQFELHAAIEMMNLGDLLCAQGEWSEGAKLLEQALERNRRLSGPRHLRTITNLNRLGNAYIVRGEPERAEPLYREALAIERELYPNDIQTAHTLAGLGMLLLRQGKPEEGLARAEEGLAITLRAVGESDPEAGMAYLNVGQMHRSAGHTDRAIPLLRKARAIFERALGPTHPRTASALSQEGLALMYSGKLSLAERDMVRAVDMLSRPGGMTVDLAGAEQNLGLLRLRQKKYPEADRLLTSALSLQERYIVRPGAEIATTLDLLSQVRTKERRFDEAARFKDRASAIQAYR
jgi:tetratricopeptide (TPR) repeat protein